MAAAGMHVGSHARTINRCSLAKHLILIPVTNLALIWPIHFQTCRQPAAAACCADVHAISHQDRLFTCQGADLGPYRRSSTRHRDCPHSLHSTRLRP